MRKTVLALVVVCVVGAATGVAASMSAATGSDRAPSLRSVPAVVEAATVPVVETDADRRARLNVRLQTMMRDGAGGRLSDPRASRPAPAARNRSPSRVAPRTRAESAPLRTAVPISNGQRIESSTILPLPVRVPTGTATTASRWRYRAPQLDLRTLPVIPTNAVECLTQAIYYEARNESEEGQAAVAEVVLNRSRMAGYPRDVCQVVYQRNSRTCQFTFTCDGSIGRSAVSMAAWARAERIARNVLEGRSPALLPSRSVNYHANYVRPSWGRRLERVRQIGAHIFYGAALGSGSTPGAAASPDNARSRPSGLVFARIDALDRAFAALRGPQQSSPTPSPVLVDPAAAEIAQH